MHVFFRAVLMRVIATKVLALPSAVLALGSVCLIFLASHCNAGENFPRSTTSIVTESSMVRGAIGFGSWNTAVEFTDVVVTDANGGVLYRSAFGSEATNEWLVMDGQWSATDGILRQSAIRPNCRLFLGDKSWGDYTVTLRARKVDGEEGFLVYFHCLDRDNWTWFNVGGWTNSLASVDQHIGARQIALGERTRSFVQKDVWYHVRIVLRGRRLECYLNDELVRAAEYETLPRSLLPGIANPVHAAQSKPRPQFFKPEFRGAVGVGTWNTAAEYRNLVVTSNDVVLYRSDFENDRIDSWRVVGGDWVITNGVLRQTDYGLGCFATIGDTNWSNYTVEVQARKLSGAEGICVIVGAFGDNHRVWLNAGSWGNTSAEIYQDVFGRRGSLTGRLPLSIERDRWYQVRVEVDGARVSCYLDSNLVHTAVASVLVSTNAIYTGASAGEGGSYLGFRIGHQEFRGRLLSDRGGPPALEPGSLVNVTGTVQPGMAAAAGGEHFDLEINSPVDVVLLRRPSWWTWRRIVIFGGILLGILATAAIWIATISRKNRLLTLAQAELRKVNEDLENRVRQRTADLAKVNASLKHEQALFRALLDTASDYIYFKDHESRFIRCSQSLCNLAGMTGDQIVGRTDFDIFQHDRAMQAYKDEQAILRTGEPLIGKLENHVHFDGRQRWVMTTKMAWRSTTGEVIGTFGISCDITPIKQAEAELKRTQNELLEASRLAGMADVAVGVLHNVGNVLNSVNVSASLLIERARQSKVHLVSRVAALMQEHSGNLAEFVTKDPRGTQLTEFLVKLSDQLQCEQARALDELAGLQTNVEHIKSIIVTQQSYATAAGVTTAFRIDELLNDALRMTAAGSGEDVELIKAIDEQLPELTMDRHKVLQILVNLLRNAKQACADGPESQKKMWVRADLHGGRIRISVQDNGVGIPKEHLTSIFRHGFTTRKNGHGLGLHSSALAAKEIGGRLLAQSDGPGRGATFTLELDVALRADDACAAPAVQAPSFCQA